MQSPYRLAALHSHPIQYFGPLYRRIAAEPDIDLTVYYCCDQGAQQYVDHGFGTSIQWDVPLLEGYRSCILPSVRRNPQVGGFLSLINRNILGELRRGKYDALWVHGHGYASYCMAVLAAKLLGIPVLMRCETHLSLKRSSAKRLLRRPVMSLFYRWMCGACMPIGSRNREFYSFHGVTPERLFSVPYAVDNTRFMTLADEYAPRRRETRIALGLPTDQALILFAGKIGPPKRPEDLLEAYRQLRLNSHDAALVFAGSGPQESALKETVSTQGIPDVYFLGFQNQSQLPVIYAISDAFVMPSENDTWGLAINEAMCARLPVIATHECGATADLVRHGENGFAYDAGDVRALTEHLRTIVADPARREQMGQKSREIIQDWDYAQCVAGIKAALAHVSPRS